MTKILAAMTAALMLAACATSASAPTVQIQVGAPRPVTGVNGTAFEITVTNTGRRTAKRIVIGCQFFDAAGVAVNTGTTFFNNLAAGVSDTNGLLSMTSGVARAVCTEGSPAKGAQH
jgi:opacity protein-like surface antigen